MKLEAQLHYPGLDLLRGVAILLVISFHFFGFAPGWMGVDLFFVLSGFLITTNLLRTREQPSYFLSFYIKRMLRIFPLYFFVLVCFYLLAPFLFSQKGAGTVYHYYVSNQLWFYFFSENWLIIRKGIPPEPYLQHLWSLAVEEQFYLLWPFVIFGIKNLIQLQKALGLIFFTAFFIRIALCLFSQGHEAYYYSSFARADSLSAGAFLAVWTRRGKHFSNQLLALSAVGFIAMLGFAFYYRDDRV